MKLWNEHQSVSAPSTRLQVLKLAGCPSISQCRVFLSLRGDQHVDRSQRCPRFSRQRNSLDHHSHFDLGLCQWTLRCYLAIRVGMARGTSPCCHLNQSYAFVRHRRSSLLLCPLLKSWPFGCVASINRPTSSFKHTLTLLSQPTARLSRFRTRYSPVHQIAAPWVIGITFCPPTISNEAFMSRGPNLWDIARNGPFAKDQLERTSTSLGRHTARLSNNGRWEASVQSMAD